MQLNHLMKKKVKLDLPDHIDFFFVRLMFTPKLVLIYLVLHKQSIVLPTAQFHLLCFT